LLTESGSDISPELAEEYGIRIVPMYVQFEGKTYADGEISPEQILAKKESIPTTSAPNPADFEHIYDQIRRELPNSIIIHIAYSAKTTSSYQNSIIGSIGYEDIYRVDSQQVSGGLGALVISTARYIKKFPDIEPIVLLDKIKELSKRMKFHFAVNDTYYLKAGGRCSNTQYLMTQLLNIKPLIEMQNGLLIATKKYRGKMESVSKKILADFFSSMTISLDEIYFVYSPGLGQESRKKIEEICLHEYHVKKILWFKAGCIISTHSGPGAFGIGGILKQ
jgi:DegV family protein with EDD domain